MSRKILAGIELHSSKTASENRANRLSVQHPGQIVPDLEEITTVGLTDELTAWLKSADHLFYTWHWSAPPPGTVPRRLADSLRVRKLWLQDGRGHRGGDRFLEGVRRYAAAAHGIVRAATPFAS